MITTTAPRRCGIATTPSTQLEVRKRSETDAESLTKVRVHPSTRVAELGSDKDHSVARDAVWRCWHLVHLNLIVVVAAVERFVQNIEGHRA